jgi:predicted secreted protein
MRLGSAIAIYFVIWWTVLFAVLPFGVRNAHEAGEDVASGHDAGAPTATGLAWKAGVTTIVSAAIFAAVYWAITSGLLGNQ